MKKLILVATEKEEQLAHSVVTSQEDIVKRVGIGPASVIKSCVFIEMFSQMFYEIVVLGTCAALSKDLNQGDIVIADKVVYQNCVGDPILYTDWCSPKEKSDKYKYVSMTSGSTFIEGNEVRNKLHKELGADTYDMETVYLVTLAETLKMPIRVIRIVSDDLKSDEFKDYEIFVNGLLDYSERVKNAIECVFNK